MWDAPGDNIDELLDQRITAMICPTVRMMVHRFPMDWIRSGHAHPWIAIHLQSAHPRFRTTALVVPRGQRRAVWRAVGFHPRRGRGLLLAVLGPMAITAVSFGLAAGFGVVRFPGLGPGLGGGVLTLAVLTIFYGFVFLGEEIGWRGFLLFRLAELTSGRRAAVLTGAFHAIFHLPLLLLTTTYQDAGNRWIVVPTVMVALTLAG